MTDRARIDKISLLWRLAAVGFLAAAGVVLTVGRASAQPSSLTAGLVQDGCVYGPCGSAVVSVTVHYHSDGTITITVTGSNFDNNDNVNISITNPSMNLGSTESSGTGTIDATYQLPAGVPAGSHTLTAVDGNSGSTVFTTSRTSGASPTCTSAYTSGRSEVVLAAVVMPAACLNQPQPGSVAGVIPPASGPPSRSPGAGSSSFLPLTGADVGYVATAGAGLVCIGGLLVLSSRRRHSRNFS